MDVYSKVKRSEIMSLIHGKNTKPEIIVRRFLFAKGMRFRIDQKSISGKPDIVLKKHRAIIFVNGCYWHGHKNCKYSKIPKTNTEYWKNKINKTLKRDSKNKSILENEGWRVFVIWECMLNPKTRDKTLSDLIQNIKDFTR